MTVGSDYTELQWRCTRLHRRCRIKKEIFNQAHLFALLLETVPKMELNFSVMNTMDLIRLICTIILPELINYNKSYVVGSREEFCSSVIIQGHHLVS